MTSSSAEDDLGVENSVPIFFLVQKARPTAHVALDLLPDTLGCKFAGSPGTTVQ